MAAVRIQEVPQEVLEAEIVTLQNLQKTHSSRSSVWLQASDMLQPLFAEMARRQNAGTLKPTTRSF